MLSKFIISICLFFIVSDSLACTCTYSEEFNLVDYDLYNYIFEVKVESKYIFKKDVIKSKKPKPPSLYEFDLLDGYNISIIEVFKGDLKLTNEVMGFAKGSSCSWSPEIGNTYIFYANSLDDVEACNRKLIRKYNKEKYDHEKSILCSLIDNPSKVKIKLDGKVVIEGAHLKNERDGIWKIYSTDDVNKIIFKLKYNKGNLLLVEKGTGYSEEKEWDSFSYSYFKEQIKK